MNGLRSDDAVPQNRVNVRDGKLSGSQESNPARHRCLPQVLSTRPLHAGILFRKKALSFLYCLIFDRGSIFKHLNSSTQLAIYYSARVTYISAFACL